MGLSVRPFLRPSHFCGFRSSISGQSADGIDFNLDGCIPNVIPQAWLPLGYTLLISRRSVRFDLSSGFRGLSDKLLEGLISTVVNTFILVRPWAWLTFARAPLNALRFLVYFAEKQLTKLSSSSVDQHITGLARSHWLVVTNRTKLTPSLWALSASASDLTLQDISWLHKSQLLVCEKTNIMKLCTYFTGYTVQQ